MEFSKNPYAKDERVVNYMNEKLMLSHRYVNALIPDEKILVHFSVVNTG